LKSLSPNNNEYWRILKHLNKSQSDTIPTPLWEDKVAESDPLAESRGVKFSTMPPMDNDINAGPGSDFPAG